MKNLISSGERKIARQIIDEIPKHLERNFKWSGNFLENHSVG
jgi:hypothetical protein